jgi:hypothetical protein
MHLHTRLPELSTTASTNRSPRATPRLSRTTPRQLLLRTLSSSFNLSNPINNLSSSTSSLNSLPNRLAASVRPYSQAQEGLPPAAWPRRCWGRCWVDIMVAHMEVRIMVEEGECFRD